MVWYKKIIQGQWFGGKADGNSEKENSTVYAQIAMGYEQISLVFKLLTYNLITSKYMLTSWI